MSGSRVASPLALAVILSSQPQHFAYHLPVRPHLSGASTTLANYARPTHQTRFCSVIAVQNSSDDDRGYPGREVVRRAFAVIFEVQNVFFNILTGLLAVGLLLNVCGIGYDFTRQEGLVIKPLAEFRQDASDRRFLRAASQMGSDSVGAAPANTPE